MIRTHYLNCRTSSELLNRIFLERRERNARYSLRSFAKSLGVSHAYLSMILNGRKHLNPQKARLILNRLNLSLSEQQFFLDLVEGHGHRRTAALEQIPTLNEDRLSVLSHWSKMAILELSKIPTFELTAFNAAHSLNLSEEFCARQIQELIEVEFLGPDERGWLRCRQPVSIRIKNSDTVVENYGAQILELARHAVAHQPPATRAFASKMFRVDAKQFAKLQEKLFGLMQEMMDEATTDDANSVYVLTAQLFSVAKLIESD